MALKPVTSPDVEAPTIQLTVDGQQVEAKQGVSLYDVISQTGKIIPAMCYHYTFDPFGSCGMCLVMVEGKKAPVRSCTAKAEAGMVVRCEGEDLFLARKKAVEKHLTIHPLDCPVCDADGHCELQDMAFQHGVTNLVNAKPKGLPEDRRSLVLDFNMNRCILCGECINICKDVQMVDALQFFKKEGTTHVVAKGDKGVGGEFCGECRAVCPVGGITNKYSKYVYKAWQVKKTTSACAYWADGCEMSIETSGKDVQRVTSPLSWKNKWGDRAETAEGHGGLCVRGRFGYQYIDSKERLGMPLVRTEEGFAPRSWFEVMDTVVGRLKAIKAQHGPNAIAGLITARCTNEELYLFQKLMRAAIGTNQVDSSARYGHLNFTRALQHAAGVGRMMNGYEEITKANVLLLIGTDTSRESAVEAVRLYAEAPKAVILCAEGMTRQVDGYAGVLNLVDLAWVTGKLTRPGCGVNALPEEANEQGAVDMGVASELLPGQALYADEDARTKFATAWRCSLPPPDPSATLMEILKRCREGRIKALYLVGENPLATLPASTGVREALEKVQLLICQDPFLTETGRLAHVVLPATTFAEKDGTFTNLEGKVNRVRPALEPYEEARPDWEIFAALGTALGYPMEYEAAQDVQREIMKFLPGYYNLGEPRPVTARPEGYLRDGYVREVAARYAAGAEADQAGRPFALTIGQVLYHSGKLSARASGLLQLYPSKGCLQMNPEDLAQLQLGLQDVVRVTSTWGSVELRTEPNHDLSRGTCFFPEHFNEPPVKDLAECVVDPTTGVPAFKFTHVAIEKL